jgi:hypothetical protein
MGDTYDELVQRIKTSTDFEVRGDPTLSSVLADLGCRHEKIPDGSSGKRKVYDERDRLIGHFDCKECWAWLRETGRYKDPKVLNKTAAQKFIESILQHSPMLEVWKEIPREPRFKLTTIPRHSTRTWERALVNKENQQHNAAAERLGNAEEK